MSFVYPCLRFRCKKRQQNQWNIKKPFYLHKSLWNAHDNEDALSLRTGQSVIVKSSKIFVFWIWCWYHNQIGDRNFLFLKPNNYGDMVLQNLSPISKHSRKWNFVIRISLRKMSFSFWSLFILIIWLKRKQNQYFHGF